MRKTILTILILALAILVVDAGEIKDTMTCVICMKPFVKGDYASDYLVDKVFKKAHVRHMFEKHEEYKQKQLQALYERVKE